VAARTQSGSREAALSVQIDEDHLRGLHEGAAGAEHRVRDLSLIARPGDAHLEHVQGLQSAPLCLCRLKMLRGRKRQAHVSTDVFEELHVPLVERVGAIGLE